MKEYIDRKALNKSIRRRFDMQDVYLPIHFLNYANSIPAADVVEVVRCKDCRSCMEFTPQYKKASGYYGTCRRLLTRMLDERDAYVKEADYCSYGKRKEGKG